MPYRKRKSAPKRKPVVRRKARVPRSIHLTPKVSQFAKIVETVNLADIQSNQAVTTAFFSLNDFNRARFESNNWQFFKAAKVTWTYEPLYNTYSDVAGTKALSKPYLYTRMNRCSNEVLPNNLLGLQGAGAMPRALTGTYKMTYKPNWTRPGLVASATNPALGQPAVGQIVTLGSTTEYGWINNSNDSQTQGPNPLVRVPGTLQHIENGATTAAGFTNRSLPSYVIYNGHDFYLDQKYADPDDTQVVCRLSMTVEWHFKGPVWNSNISTTC